VAGLARSFNRAAERIQELVEAQRRQLAFASHELRSPLARLRVSLEMMAGDPALKARAAGDIAELDGLVDELLESSRLQARGGLDRAEAVDLLALAAEEAARGGAEASGEPVVVQGDARLLRRLVRNLLDNARRHGAAALVEVRLEAAPGALARLLVSDRGPGVADGERERVFEPFYRPAGSSETGSGYGLGLALVRQIARAHGGEARCLARDGGGSVFAVELPVGR
jgi:signal transduction histidine kinase